MMPTPTIQGQQNNQNAPTYGGGLKNQSTNSLKQSKRIGNGGIKGRRQYIVAASQSENQINEIGKMRGSGETENVIGGGRVDQQSELSMSDKTQTALMMHDNQARKLTMKQSMQTPSQNNQHGEIFGLGARNIGQKKLTTSNVMINEKSKERIVGGANDSSVMRQNQLTMAATPSHLNKNQEKMMSSSQQADNQILNVSVTIANNSSSDNLLNQANQSSASQAFMINPPGGLNSSDEDTSILRNNSSATQNRLSKRNEAQTANTTTQNLQQMSGRQSTEIQSKNVVQQYQNLSATLNANKHQERVDSDREIYIQQKTMSLPMFGVRQPTLSTQLNKGKLSVASGLGRNQQRKQNSNNLRPQQTSESKQVSGRDDMLHHPAHGVSKMSLQTSNIQQNSSSRRQGEFTTMSSANKNHNSILKKPYSDMSLSTKKQFAAVNQDHNNKAGNNQRNSRKNHVNTTSMTLFQNADNAKQSQAAGGQTVGRHKSLNSQNSMVSTSSIDRKLPKVSAVRGSSKETRVPVGERYVDTNAKVFGLKNKQQQSITDTKRSQPMMSMQQLLNSSSYREGATGMTATNKALKINENLSANKRLIGKTELIKLMLDQNEETNKNKFTNQKTDRAQGAQNQSRQVSLSPAKPGAENYANKVDTIGKLLENESQKRALMINRGFYTGPLDSQQSYGTVDIAQDDDDDSSDEDDEQEEPMTKKQLAQQKKQLNNNSEQQSPQQIRRLFNLKNLREMEIAKKKKKERPEQHYPTRMQFYEHLNKVRYDRQKMLQSIGIETRAKSIAAKNQQQHQSPSRLNAGSSLTSKDLSFSFKQASSPRARKIGAIQARNQFGTQSKESGIFLTQTESNRGDKMLFDNKLNQKPIYGQSSKPWDISHWLKIGDSSPAVGQNEQQRRNGVNRFTSTLPIKSASVSRYQNPFGQNLFGGTKAAQNSSIAKKQYQGPKDTSFASLNNPNKRIAAKSNEGDESCKHEFGIDIEEFLNQKSAVFRLYNQTEFNVEPFHVHSVDEAIEHHNERKRNFENLVYSAANLNRPVERCQVCKLDHPPLLPDVLAIRAEKKEAKRDKKKDEIRNQIIGEIKHAQKRQEDLKLRSEYLDIEQQYRQREEKLARKDKMGANFDKIAILEDQTSDNEEDEGFDALGVNTEKSAAENIKQLKSMLKSVNEENYNERHHKMMSELRIRKILQAEKIKYPTQETFDKRRAELTKLYTALKGATLKPLMDR